MGPSTIDHTPNDIKVSIVMLTFNNAPYIETSVAGVLSQVTDYNIQLVISDDMSTDDTYAICQRLASAYPDKITLLRSGANRGIPQNFLYAYSFCKGQYVAMCDGDDYWCHTGKLQAMTDYMDCHPECALAFHRVINYYEDDNTKSLSNGGQKQDTTILDLARGNFITNCSSLWRRRLNPEPPAWVGSLLLCDYAMHLLNAEHGYIHYFPLPMAVYRKRSDALWTGVKQEQRYRDALAVRMLALEHFKNNPEVYPILLDNYTRNAFSLLRMQRQQQLDPDQNVANLLSLHPDWSEQALETAYEAWLASCKGPSMARRFISWCRALISKLVALPKPRLP